MARANGADPTASAQACARVDAGTPLALVLVESVTSARGKPGDAVVFRTAEPVTCGVGNGLPADLPVTGEVLHAASAGAWRRAGELVVVARHLEWRGRRYAVRALHLGGSAAPRDFSTARQIFAPRSGGHDLVFDAGMRASAKLVESIELMTRSDSMEPVR